MKRTPAWQWIAQCFVVLLCAYSLKLFYSKAGANELRWILAPTAAAVELVSGTAFEFEPNAGYMSADRHFLIAPSCAGVNFLITAFVMLSARRLLRGRFGHVAWGFIPAAALAGYLVTLVANTTRIAIALRLGQTIGDVGWLTPSQVHRFEGIFIYFTFLLLLFVATEQGASERRSRLLGRTFLPLLVYYATMLGVPLANGAYGKGTGFREYSLFVVLIPLVLMLPIAALRSYRQTGCLKSCAIQRNSYRPES